MVELIDRCDLFFFSSRRRHTRWTGDWSPDVCSSDLANGGLRGIGHRGGFVGGRQLDQGVRRHGRARGRQEEKGRQSGGDRDRVVLGAVVRRRSGHRSEERRVGKEGRSGWAAERERKK